MPFKASFHIPELAKAQALAESVGWQYAELAGDMLRTCSTSFKRCLIENKSRLLKGVSSDRRHVIEDAIACEYLPLDVQSWGNLRERYFKEFAPSMDHFEEAPMARAFKKVCEKWMSETAMPETIVA